MSRTKTMTIDDIKNKRSEDESDKVVINSRK